MTHVTSPGDQARIENPAKALSTIRRLRGAIARRFFPADVPAPGQKKTPIWLYPLITVACGGLALARLGPAGPNTFWAEDGQVFYTGAVAHPLRSFTEPWHGYWQTAPRVVAVIVALFPVSWAAAANAVANALIIGLLAALIYRACAAHIRTPGLRLIPAVVTAICPIASETWGANASLMWPMYFTVVLVLLWNPRRPVPIVIGAVLAILLTLTSAFGIVLAPIAVTRIIVLGRDRGSVIPAVTLAGTIVQTTDMLMTAGRQTYTTVAAGKLASNYLYNVVERGFFGTHYQIADYETAGAAVLVAVTAAIIGTGLAGRARHCALAALMLVYSIGFYTVVLVVGGAFAGGSTGDRYYVTPLLLLVYAMVVAFDAAITAGRPGPAGFPRGRKLSRLTAAALCTAVTGCLAFSVATDWRLQDPSRQAPTWSASLSGARAWCVGKPGNRAVRLRITASHPDVPWYVTLDCSRVG